MKIVLKNGVLQELMEQYDLSVYGLAEKLEVAPTTIYRIMNGSRGLGNDMIAKLLNTFALSEADFDKLFILQTELPKGNSKSSGNKSR
ncbi:helix-turn-helix domain-containing protein [Enterococcus raffinosus]|uniref:helix-turn-helix domain-containing protein n=1 Tax=Enterococcus raffinosus TaxID=71452 RepID=UPI003DA22E16